LRRAFAKKGQGVRDSLGSLRRSFKQSLQVAERGSAPIQCFALQLKLAMAMG
jgi:hypothetical protein